MSFKRAILLLGATFWIGCVPVPLLIPPIKVDAGVAAKGGPEGIAATFPLRAGIHLLQLNPNGYFRSFDIGPGWSVFPVTSGELRHGPYLEGGLLWPVENGPRWGTNVKAHYLFSGQERPHAAAFTVQGTVEWADWSDGVFGECSSSEGCAFGVSHGEASIGFFLEASTAIHPGQAADFWAGGGLILRIPMSVGFLMVPLWELDSDD
ncbi:hypothetical protein FRD01_22020 [Microvenator marinus]|uniref:Lipoprotein n=1 Tax=Microvenator marinus TaxID=2600177 RepID=A0A5B8XWE1_9DELT|nr:hypothetical protein [Microvenator marinus]QED29860.1 hypothetical protein FRD01_22020 [Microvenator marinus]